MFLDQKPFLWIWRPLYRRIYTPLYQRVWSPLLERIIDRVSATTASRVLTATQPLLDRAQTQLHNDLQALTHGTRIRIREQILQDRQDLFARIQADADDRASELRKHRDELLAHIQHGLAQLRQGQEEVLAYVMQTRDGLLAHAQQGREELLTHLRQEHEGATAHWQHRYEELIARLHETYQAHVLHIQQLLNTANAHTREQLDSLHRETAQQWSALERLALVNVANHSRSNSRLDAELRATQHPTHVWDARITDLQSAVKSSAEETRDLRHDVAAMTHLLSLFRQQLAELGARVQASGMPTSDNLDERLDTLNQAAGSLTDSLGTRFSNKS